jgi:hypothetical protein
MEGRILRRTWVFSEGQSDSWMIWDFGDEMWELKDEVLRHFGVVKRTLESPQKLEEIVELLCDSPIPLEAVQRRFAGIGWIVSEEVISSFATASFPQAGAGAGAGAGPAPARGGSDDGARARPRPGARARPGAEAKAKEKGEASVLATVLDSQAETPAVSVKRKNHGRPQDHQQRPAVRGVVQVSEAEAPHLQKSAKPKRAPKPKEHDSSKRKSSNTASTPKKNWEEESQSSQISVSPSQDLRHLWSSLSEWIPASALYQPSLHSQAFLELSDKPVHIFVSPTKTPVVLKRRLNVS